MNHTIPKIFKLSHPFLVSEKHTQNPAMWNSAVVYAHWKSRTSWLLTFKFTKKCWCWCFQLWLVYYIKQAFYTRHSFHYLTYDLFQIQSSNFSQFESEIFKLDIPTSCFRYTVLWIHILNSQESLFWKV